MKNKGVMLLIASLFAVSATAEDTKDLECKKGDTKCENKIKLAPVTIEATRSEVDSLTYPGSVGVIGEDTLKRETSVVDAITDIPGVESGYDNGRQIGQDYRIRGFGYQSENRVIIMQDGVPRSPSLFSNHISSFRSDNDILKSVEVVKGTSSILHGSGAIGGIVGMQTKDAKDYLEDGEQFGAMLGQRVESNHMRSTRAAIYAKGDENIPLDVVLYGKKAKHGNMKYAGGGTTSASGNALTHVPNDEDIQTAFFKLGWDITDEQRLAISVFDYKEDLTTVWQTLYHNSSSTDIIGTLTQRDYVLDYYYNPEKYSWLNLSAKVYKSEAEYDRGYTTEEDILDYSNQDDRWGIKIKNIASFDTYAVNHNLVTGIDYQNRKEDAIFVSNGEISDFGSMPNKYEDFGLYIQDIMSYKDFELTLGGRFDKFNRDLTHRENAKDYSDSRFSPRVALGYTLFDTITLLAGYSESFRAPTPHETSPNGPLNPHYWYLPNSNLEAETGAEYEVGFSVERNGLFANNDAFTFKAMYFTGKIKNMISFKELPELGMSPEDSPYGRYENVNDAHRHGYEIEANYAINSWKYGASYEHLRLYNKENGKVLRPFADKLNLNLEYKIISGLRAGLELNHWFKPYQSPKTITYMDRRTRQPVTYTYVNKGYTQVNLMASWDVKNTGIKFLDNNMHINFGVKNLLDKKYLNARSVTNTSRVGMGRNIYLDFEINF